MQLPKNIQELGEIFRNAHCPELSEFKGEYLVDMLTLPSFKRISHRKFFYHEDAHVKGYNMFFTDIKWGSFFLEQGVCEGKNSVKAVIINYNIDGNLFITRGIRDYVRCIERGILYIGRFKYVLMGKLYFLGYFSLSKVR